MKTIVLAGNKESVTKYNEILTLLNVPHLTLEEVPDSYGSLLSPQLHKKQARILFTSGVTSDTYLKTIQIGIRTVQPPASMLNMHMSKFYNSLLNDSVKIISDNPLLGSIPPNLLNSVVNSIAFTRKTMHVLEESLDSDTYIKMLSILDTFNIPFGTIYLLSNNYKVYLSPIMHHSNLTLSIAEEIIGRS